MKRNTLNLVFLAASAFLLTAANVRVKRLEGGGESQGNNAESQGGGIIRQGSGGQHQGGGESRTTPSTPARDNDRGGWRGGHSDSSTHGRQIQSESIQPRTSQVTVGVGRTRIVRQSHTPAPETHGAIAGNRTIIRQIERDRRVEVVPNHQYWHRDGGQRWVHNYHGGIHWYGFYHGRNFYWTRYYRDRWWWYDNGFSHWVFWANGRWWWNGPGGVLYVYVNDSYFPYDEAPITVAAPTYTSAPAEETENNGGEWTSRDGERMVQIHGPQAEAFLYDKSSGQPRYLAYLGKNVERVRFSGGSDGRPVRILVDFKNADFTLFSSEGEPVDLTPPETPLENTDDGPPNPPTDIPK